MKANKSMSRSIPKKFTTFLSFCIILLFGCIVNSASGQLTAAFKADTTSGCAPLIVQFFDQSTGNPTKWLWSLGNGITSTQKNPTTFYFEPGSYTITLTVSRGAETRTITKQKYIAAHASPAINFKALADTTGCTPLKVQFADFSQPRSGSISSFQWDYGDGTFSPANTAHVYDVAGNFTVTLKVTNSFGCSSIKGKSNYIVAKEGVKARFGVTNNTSCKTPVPIRFTDSSKGVGIIMYKWNFGDGAMSSVKNPLHNYANWGSYKVSLAVSNLVGCTDTLVGQNAVVIGRGTSSFSFIDSSCSKSPLNFTNTSVPLTQTIQWIFGDGNTSSQIQPVNTYDKPGTYVVSLINIANGCADTVRKRITVLNAPDANFTADMPVSACKGPLSINFKNKEAGVKYLWNFGDGSTSTGAAPTHIFKDSGNYKVSLQLTGKNGCATKVVKDSFVYIGPPVIQGFKGLPFSHCAPSTLTLMANIIQSEPIATYEWNLGDGTTSNQATPRHTYANTGKYAISLKVTTVNGCTASYTLPAALITNEPPTAFFNAIPTSACVLQNIQFNNLSTGNITRYLWNFGDGNRSPLQNAVHAYSDTGNYTVTLLVSNNGCNDSIVLKNLVRVNPPVAKFTTKFNCASPGLGIFTNQSKGATTWLWNFGDGTTSNVSNPQHQFNASGTYIVKLLVTNGVCQQQFSDTVYVIYEKPVLNIGASAFCKNTVASFTTSNINPSLISNYQWIFGDGKSSRTTNSFTNYSYTTSGTYTPKLIITDLNGCNDTANTSPTIQVFGPDAGFFTQNGTCVNTLLTFTDSSKTYSNFDITKWSWDYGDGVVEDKSAGPFKHTYTKKGRYIVKLTVTDSRGCFDSETLPYQALITDPKANLLIRDSINCTSNNISFTNLSAGEGLKYLWNFGDGTTSKLSNPAHIYQQSGIFDISLTISDIFGCTDSIFQPQKIKVANVHAVMNVSDTASSCPPFKISLKNESINYNEVVWRFDDGGFSELDKPSHYYIIPGVYNLQLIAKGFAGCADTAYQKIVLKGPTGTFDYYPKSVCASGSITFQSQSTSRTYLIWDYGDGITLNSTNSTVLHTYENTGRYVPKVLLVDQDGCQVPIIGKDSISVITINAGIAQVPSLYCDSASVQFADASSILFDTSKQYIWNFGDGTVLTKSEANPIHQYTSPGSYRVSVKVVTSAGCSDTASLQTEIKVVRSPAISVFGNIGVCISDPIVYNGNLLLADTSAINWQWSFGNGQTASVKDPPAQVYSAAGNYIVTVFASNSSGCASPFSVPLQVYDLPTVNAGIDTTICVDASILLRPSGALSYRWNTSPYLSCTACDRPAARMPDNTNFVVEGMSDKGCKNRDTLLVKVVKPLKISVSPGDTLCLGESIRLTVAGGNIYQWSPAAGLINPQSSNILATPLQTTVYQVIATDSQYCYADTGKVQATVYPIPTFSVIKDAVTILVGESTKLHSTSSADVVNWRWRPSLGLSCSRCAEPIASPRSTTNYTVEGINQGGCKTEDKVTVTVICNNTNIFIPNTFSPNNDGMNDVFFPRGKGIAHIRSMLIFNRLGVLVFSKKDFGINNQLSGWNGSYNGSKQPSDVYVYSIDVVCDNNEVFSLKGNITLIN